MREAGIAYDSELARLHAEQQHIVSKDSMFTDAETKRLAQITQILRATPDLQSLLIALEIRQREETAAMFEKLRSPEGRAGTYKDDYADMLERHDGERDRHIGDYERALELRRELDADQARRERRSDRDLTR